VKLFAMPASTCAICPPITLSGANVMSRLPSSATAYGATSSNPSPCGWPGTERVPLILTVPGTPVPGSPTVKGHDVGGVNVNTSGTTSKGGSSMGVLAT
jgi:hypothetical protein